MLSLLANRMPPRCCLLSVLWLWTSSPLVAVEFSVEKLDTRDITVVRVDPKVDRLRMFHRDDAGLPLKRLDTLAAWRKSKGESVVFAMNAGMYHGDFSAVGLHLEDGEERSPLNLDEGEGNFFLKPNGVFLLSEVGAQVITASEYPQITARVMQATQSGPILLRNGRIHPAFKLGSINKLHRNAVGVTRQGIVVFAITEEPVNFHEFATFYRDKLECPDALFLDGTVCSLYAPQLKRNDFRMELGPMIAVTIGSEVVPPPK